MDYSATTNPISPSTVSLVEFNLTETTTLIWPFAGLDGTNVIASVMIIDEVTVGANLWMPPANQGSLGYTTMIVNLGANAFNIQDNTGGAIDNIAAGQVKIINLRTQANAAGTWLSNTFGATTSAANAALLAGFGLTAIATTLNVNIPANNFSATQSFSSGNRAQLYVWTGGAGAANFTSSSAGLGDGWWMAFRNAGTGVLALTPTSPDEIDGLTSENMNPGDSCIVISTGSGIYTVGLGQATVFTDSQANVNVAGGTNVTLSAVQYANNILNFIGALTGNINVIFPSAIKNYWLRNNTTGAYSLTAITSGGTGIVIPQNGASVVTCDGTNIDSANTSSGGTVNSVIAGTGLNGGVITTAGTISIANTGAVAGTYTDGTGLLSFTINAQGQITSVTSGGTETVGTVTNVTFTGDGTVLSSTPSSAVTTTGTVTATLNTQSANLVFAGPSSGSAANPTFRTLVTADLPTATSSTLGVVKPDNSTINISGGVLSAVTPLMTPLAVGSIIVAACSSTITAGTTYNASTLTVKAMESNGIWGQNSGDSITGTWIALASGIATQGNLFQRVS